MKLISWNVNGIRAILKKGFVQTLGELDADIVCLQEVKANPEQVALEIKDYRHFWNPAERRGYSGTVILTRVEALKVTPGIGVAQHDSEGRVMTAEFGDFFLVNVYTPNSQRALTRLDYRVQWDKDFLKYLKKLEKKKPVIFCGDLNVAHTEIDLANPKANVKNHGFTPKERAGFTSLVKAGFIDTFREFNQEGGHYTWWSQMNNARARNVGWRIDYFCISSSLRPRLQAAFILSEVMGSDHCPVGMLLK